MPHVLNEPPNGCLGDIVPFLPKYISKLVDVLWLVRLSLSPKDVPQMFNWIQV